VSPLTEYSEATFDRVMAVNVKGVWLGLKAIVPALGARGGGAIVNTASVAGLRASPTLGPYSASKHAVIGLTRTAAVELARRGIRVNAVCPAPIDTPMVRQFGASARPTRSPRSSSFSSAPTPPTSMAPSTRWTAGRWPDAAGRRT